MSLHRYRPEIDGLRAVAILPVVLLHANFPWISGGFVGVDIFFVISGYLITAMIIQDLKIGNFRFSDFWLRRARRILPALITVALFSLIAGWFFFLPDDFKSLGRSAFALSLFSSNIYFWLKTGYFTAPADTKPLLHTWSLAVEEQFYLLFPFILYVITRYIPAFRMKLVCLFMLLSLSLTLISMKNYQIAAFFLLPTRAWELLIGSIIALYFSQERRKHKPIWFNELFSFIGLLAIVYAFFYLDKNSAFPEAAILPCFGAAAIIASNQNKLTYVGRALSLRIMVAIGLISYSLYLWHWPFLVFSKYVATSPLTLMQTSMIVIGSLLISWISYTWIETPIRKKRFLIQSKTLIFTMVSIASMIAILGLMIDFKHGAPNRLSPAVFAAYQEASHRPEPTCQTVAISKNVTVCTNAKPTDKPDFILWGDSHADMLVPIVEKYASQHQLKFWYYSCIPILDTYRVDLYPSLLSSSCTISNHELVRLINQKQIKNVFFASFWTQFTEGKEVPMEGAGQRDPFYGDANMRSTTPKQARIVFRKHFAETVKKLEEAGADIWIMKQVPTHLYWVPNQFAKILKYGGDANQIGRPLAEQLQRQAFIDSVFDEVKTDKVHLLDPASILCDESNFCHGSENGHALYRDFNHLSTHGVAKLTPLLDKMFITISNKKTNNISEQFYA